MMIKKIKIPYFSVAFKWVVSLLLFATAVYLAVIGYAPWIIILLALVIIILTTCYVTEIDLQQKKYRDYLFFLGFCLNEDLKKFQRLDKIVITKGNYSQNATTRSRSRQLDWSDYTGTLLVDDDGALDLLTESRKVDLIKGLKVFVEFLKIDVEDRTTNQPYLIDMEKI